jgi:hypothetical protein
VTREHNTSQAGNRAGSANANGHNGHGPDADDRADMNGRQPGDEGFNPFDTRAANSKHGEDREHGSAAAATVVGGLYAAEHGRAMLSLAGYAAVAALEGIAVPDAKAARLINHNPSEADVARWYSERGQQWVSPTKASVDRAGLRAASRGLDPAHTVALTTIDALAAEGVSWAETTAAQAAADNLDMAVKAKNHSFTLAELYNHYGAAVADLVGLAPMTTTTRLASLRLLRQWAAEENLRAQNDARKRLAATEVAEIKLPPVTCLDALLALPGDPVRMRIESVWPAGGCRTLNAAPAGAGKTTLNCNLIRSLVDGDPFLDAFEVHQCAERIVVIDLEMNQQMLKRWLSRQGVRNTAGVVDVVTLRGEAGLFDLGNDKLRDMWARRLRDLGCDFVIFDCLSPVIHAMGLKEATELGKFLCPLNEMLKEAGVADVLVHHHMGHVEERARGDSTALGWSDANWKQVIDGDHPLKPRYFSTSKVRDADEPVGEGLLSFDKATGRLTYAGGNRAETGKSEAVEKRLNEVLEVLADRQAEGFTDDKGMGTTAIKTAVKGGKTITDKALALADERKLVILHREGRAKRYRIKPDAMDPLYAGDDSDLDAPDGIAEVVNVRQPRDAGPTG